MNKDFSFLELPYKISAEFCLLNIFLLLFILRFFLKNIKIRRKKQ